MSLDVLDEETLVEAGRLVWERGGAPVFGVGSQGLEAALVAYWRASGLSAGAGGPRTAGRVERIACVSGSVSPGHGEPDRLRGRAMASPASASMRRRPWTSRLGRRDRTRERARRCARSGPKAAIRSSITAAGPDDPAVAALRQAVATAGVSAESVNDRIGSGLGRDPRRRGAGEQG